MQGGRVGRGNAPSGEGHPVLPGSIGSTQVLHRSGIGPADWLAPLGIDVVFDRQGVGRNLQGPPATARDLQGFLGCAHV